MKKYVEAVFILLVNMVSAGYVSGQNADNILVNDTRAVNDPPSAYQRNVKFEFKTRDVIAVPGSGLYSGLMTIAPWSDNSGNKNHQLNFNDGGIYYRQGLPQGNWEPWKKMVIENEYGSVGIGTGNPMEKLHVRGASTGFLVNPDFNGSTYLYSYDHGRAVYTPMVLQGATLQFQTGTSSFSERMKIQPNGFVGIGTPSPETLLHISSSNSNAVSLISGNDPYIFAGLRFADLGQNTAGKVREWTIWAGRDGGTWGSGLGFMRYDAVNPCEGGICDLSLFLHDNGNVGVGTINPSEKLSVNGNVRAKKVIVSQTGWADYVFDSAYVLKSLNEVDDFIKLNKRLPGIPAAKEIESAGLDMGEIIKKQQEKIEELTLYIIQQNKRLEQLEKKMAAKN